MHLEQGMVMVAKKPRSQEEVHSPLGIALKDQNPVIP
jgi:hypothetical protein